MKSYFINIKRSSDFYVFIDNWKYFYLKIIFKTFTDSLNIIFSLMN